MIQINKQQAEVLLRYMIEAAQAAVDDHESYGQERYIFLTKAETLAHELNELSE